jgi:Cache domain
MSARRIDVETRAACRNIRGRLFRKYLVLILLPVTVALLASNSISVYFSYQEIMSGLATLQHEKALAAASWIEEYLWQIEQQLTYAALPQLDANDVELRRIAFLKLLRQAPEVTDISQLDAYGYELIAVSRLGLVYRDPGKDRSEEPAFREAECGQPWAGPVYFPKETEPYMTIAIRSCGDKGSVTGPVTVAEVNLKFILEVVSRIRIGDKGQAYIVDGNGFLIAGPDAPLRKLDVSDLPHVKAAIGNQNLNQPASPSHCLRLTKSPCDEILEECCNPCAACAADIARATSILDVVNRHLERLRLRMARRLVRHPLNFERKIGGRKPEANNFCCKRKVVAPGNQVMVAATK